MMALFSKELPPARLAIEVQVSDLHVGSRLGICPPGALDDSGAQIGLNPYQKWLLDCWEETWDDVEALIKQYEKEYGQRIYRHLSVLGEPADIDWKKRSNQFWTKNRATARRAAIQLLDPIIDEYFDAVHFVRGTEAHGGSENEMDELIADNYDQTVRNEDTGTASWWSAEIEPGGVLFDLGHHGKRGTLPWTEENGLISLREQIAFRRYREGEPVPDIISRGHYHFFLETNPHKKPYAYILPAWQATTSYGHRIDPTNRKPQCGCIFIICKDGEFVRHPIVKKWERKKPWKPSSQK
jgi:hypothetical protein